MANIDLNKIFVNRRNTVSNIDSNIILNKPKNKSEIFSDCKMDLQLSEKTNSSLYSNVIERDLAKITDEEAILQSLRNLINTKFHSRLLNPEINFDLRSYLFENVSEAKAYFIGYDIISFLPIYEPRIVVNHVDVKAYYNNDTYSINIEIGIPSINKNVNLSTILNSDGFTFI
jgi:phage baseplate assembly protein W